MKRFVGQTFYTRGDKHFILKAGWVDKHSYTMVGEGANILRSYVEGGGGCDHSNINEEMDVSDVR